LEVKAVAMSRPCNWRNVGGRPQASVFKPAGIPRHELDEVVMTLDEFEALRLADLEGLYQEQAALEMRVSRPTFSRIAESARRKVADALVHGKALRIEGGPVHLGRPRCCRRHDPLAADAESPPAAPSPATPDPGTPSQGESA
jgi:uncharacterized protein